MRSLVHLLGVGLLCAMGGCSRQTADPTRVLQPLFISAGQTYSVHLQGGFRGDRVEIFVDRQLAYAGRPTTKEVLGFAQVVFGFTSGAKSAVVRVRVPAQHIDAEETVDLGRTRAIGISILGKAIQIIRTEAAGFGYF